MKLVLDIIACAALFVAQTTIIAPALMAVGLTLGAIATSIAVAFGLVVLMAARHPRILGGEW